MKNLITLIVFVSSSVIGLISSNPNRVTVKLDNFIHQDCARWDKNVTSKQQFTLSEAKDLFGKRVVSKNIDFKKDETGRIVYLQMIGEDKYLVQIYWGKGSEDSDSMVTFHNKEDFVRFFEFVD